MSETDPLPYVILPKLSEADLERVVAQIHDPRALVFEESVGDTKMTLVEVPSVLKDPEANTTVATVVGSLFKRHWQEKLPE